MAGNEIKHHTHTKKPLQGLCQCYVQVLPLCGLALSVEMPILGSGMVKMVKILRAILIRLTPGRGESRIIVDVSVAREKSRCEIAGVLAYCLVHSSACPFSSSP